MRVFTKMREQYCTRATARSLPTPESSDHPETPESVSTVEQQTHQPNTSIEQSPMIKPIRPLKKPPVKAPGGVECNNPHCRTKYASAWRTNPEGGWLCNACGIFIRTKGYHRPPEVINRVYKTTNDLKARTVPRKDTIRKRKIPETTNNADTFTESLTSSAVITRSKSKNSVSEGLTSKNMIETRSKKKIRECSDDDDTEMSEALYQKTQDEPLPWNRKEYLKCGLYSMDLKVNKSTKRNSKETVKEISSEVFPLPVQYGQFLMTDRRNFRLPWDIMTAHKSGLLQREYRKIQTNVYIDRKRKNEKPVICDCKPPSDGGPGCTEDCYNRHIKVYHVHSFTINVVMFYECSPKHCPCGKQCTNQRFQRKESVKELKVFKTGNRGYGLLTLGDVRKDQLILEYRGEVISHNTAIKRMETKYKYMKSIYFLDYENRAVVDGALRGTEARFINHSCAPNCHIEK
ncbi:8285_t:CDS:2, partial [Acaulospora morrowiae]